MLAPLSAFISPTVGGVPPPCHSHTTNWDIPLDRKLSEPVLAKSLLTDMYLLGMKSSAKAGGVLKERWY